MITLFWFLWVSLLQHNPMVEKPGAPNITAYENQGNQRELSDH